MLKIALATAAPTMPSTIFITSPMSLFMNCSASQPAIAPMMIAAIQPIVGSFMACLLQRRACAIDIVERAKAVNKGILKLAPPGRLDETLEKAEPALIA
jgi:hypothetical protein